MQKDPLSKPCFYWSELIDAPPPKHQWTSPRPSAGAPVATARAAGPPSHLRLKTTMSRLSRKTQLNGGSFSIGSSAKPVHEKGSTTMVNLAPFHPSHTSLAREHLPVWCRPKRTAAGRSRSLSSPRVPRFGRRLWKALSSRTRPAHAPKAAITGPPKTMRPRPSV